MYFSANLKKKSGRIQTSGHFSVIFDLYLWKLLKKDNLIILAQNYLFKLTNTLQEY